MRPEISPSSDSRTMLPSLEPSGLVHRTRDRLRSGSVSFRLDRNVGIVVVVDVVVELSVRHLKSATPIAKVRMLSVAEDFENFIFFRFYLKKSFKLSAKNKYLVFKPDWMSQRLFLAPVFILKAAIWTSGGHSEANNQPGNWKKITN